MVRALLLVCACVTMATVCAAMTESVTGKPTLQIVWMVPFIDHPRTSFVYNASSSVAALALGLDTIKNLYILTQFDFNVSFIDTGCSSKQSLGALIELINQIHVDVVLGPACAHVVTTVAEVMSYRDVPIISWVSLGQTIADKGPLNTFIRTMAPMTSLGALMAKFFFATTQWKRFVMISCEGDDYVAGAQIIEDNLAMHEGNGFQIVHHYSGVHRQVSGRDIDNMLKAIKREGRIIILVIPRDELRKYMLRAHALDMTSGDYQFLYTEAIIVSEIDMAIINSDVLWKQNDEYDEAARQAFRNVLIFVLGHDTTPIAQWSPAAKSSYYTHFGNRTRVPKPTEPDRYACYLHDALVLYALSLNQSLAHNNTGRGADIFLWAIKQHFRGLSGDVVMDSKGDRQPAFFVYDLDPNDIFQQVASLRFTINPSKDKRNVTSTFTKILWGDGTSTPDVPRDTPVCGFQNEFCPETTPETQDNYLMISLATSIPGLVILLAMYILYRWWRWEKDLKNMGWKINPADLDYSFSRRAFSASLARAVARSASLGSQTSVDGISRRKRASTGLLDSQHGRFDFAHHFTDATPNYVDSAHNHIDSAQSHIEHATEQLHEAQIFTLIARYNGEIVAVKRSLKKKITIDRSFLLEMKHMVGMKHGNLTNFIGVCTAPEKICSVWEYCNKGSLQDVIENDDIRLDTMFKMSMTVDICQGLDYIHKSPLKFHGNLRSSNCVIDNRWVCKLTDFGLQSLRVAQDPADIGDHAYYANLFWTAPEVLRKILVNDSYEGSHKGDVYSLGIIIKELLCRNEPFSTHFHLTPKEIIHRVAYPDSEDDIFRPVIQASDLEEDFRRRNMEYLIHRCWAESPDDRPVVKAVLRLINKLNPYKKASVVDNMIAMMEKYTDNLEDIVAERTQQLQEEKRKTDALLYRMLPERVAEDLKMGRAVQAEAFDSVTIYFSDIVHFTALASESSPLQIVDFLNALYTLFDDIISYYDAYKVETIGDAYMVVSGLPERNGQQHVREIASAALDILNNVLNFKIPHDHERQLQIRIGLHTGPVVAGVVGLTMPRYCLFGDTVNTASRMESTGAPLKIHISAATRDALSQYTNFTTEERGEVPIKGKGLMKTFWLTGVYCSGKEMARNPFHKVTGLNKETTSDDKLQSEEPDKAVNNLDVVQDVNEGKLSITDSGIVSDKCPETESGTDVKYDKHDIATVIEEHNKNEKVPVLTKTRHISVDFISGDKEADDSPARRTWPKLPTFEDLELDLMNTESDDDVLFETAVNHFIDQERKISHPNVYQDMIRKPPVFEIITEPKNEDDYTTTKSKSHAKYKITKSDIKKKKKRKKRSYSDKSDGEEKYGGDVLKIPGIRDTVYFSDEYDDSHDDHEVGLSNQSSPLSKLRGVRSANNSPRTKGRIEKSNTFRKINGYDEEVVI